MGKLPCCDEGEVKKGPWTQEEDERLIDYINKNGYGKWRTLPKNAGLRRCGKSCRLRWTNYLRPDIKRGKFSAEEEDAIIQLHRLLGNKWSAIAGRLPGRTDNEIKNFWNTQVKKKLWRMGVDPVTHTPRRDLLQLSSLISLSLLGQTSNLSIPGLHSLEGIPLNLQHPPLHYPLSPLNKQEPSQPLIGDNQFQDPARYYIQSSNLIQTPIHAHSQPFPSYAQFPYEAQISVRSPEMNHVADYTSCSRTSIGESVADNHFSYVSNLDPTGLSFTSHLGIPPSNGLTPLNTLSTNGSGSSTRQSSEDEMENYSNMLQFWSAPNAVNEYMTYYTKDCL